MVGQRAGSVAEAEVVWVLAGREAESAAAEKVAELGVGTVVVEKAVG